jgi:hypothetical protein
VANSVATYLDLNSVKAYLRLNVADTLDDALLVTVMFAVEAEQRARCKPEAFSVIEPPPTDPEVPTAVAVSDVYHAALMRCARLYVRRASPEGLVGLGDLGVARVPTYDRDIDALEAPWRVVVLA